MISFAAEPAPKNVLLLYYDNPGNASRWVQLFDKGFRSALGNRIGKQINLNIEYTGLARNPSLAYRKQLIGLLRMKYGKTPPDLIIVEMNPRADFLKSLFNDLFPKAKIIFSFYDASDMNVLDLFPGRATGIYIETARDDPTRLIQRVLPETKNIVVIGGASQPIKSQFHLLSATFNAHADRFKITYLVGMPLDQILESVGRLPPHSVIYFLSYMTGANGESYNSYDVLSLISKHADAPIFSFNGIFMGDGLLGGKLVSGEEVGRNIAQLAIRILGGGNPADIKPYQLTGRYMFSWKEMQKWRVDEKRLPAGSIIKYREYSFFDKYKSRIIFWVGVMILQFGLIAYLITTLGLRKRAEKERVRLETALRQAQKMESIGTLAGGIAHDFNNILSPILGYTELTLMDQKPGTESESNLRQVLKAGKRAKDLVNQILTFARKSQEEPVLVNIRAVAEDALRLLRSTIPTSIEIKKNLTSDSEVLADRTRIHQIFLNLCANSLQAMENGTGTLSVDLSDVVLENDDILPPGAYIKILVSDTGSGIAREHLGQIFDPYFTTKKTGDGTGLGLSVVLGIVEGYGGKVMVESELDRGTTFAIYLPISKSGPRGQSPVQGPLQEGSERILFVDDEPDIVQMNKQLLERQGYRVTCATDSIAALALFKEKPNSFDIVITDMTMPRMTGDMLASELGKIRSDIPVILCTGYNQRLLSGEIDTNRIKTILMKPVSQKELTTTVRQILATGFVPK